MANQRLIKDAAKSTSTTCPAAAANKNSATIDLEQVSAAGLENMVLEVVVPATTALVATKVLTIKFQDSADDSTYADIEELEDLVVTGITGNGNVKTEHVVYLPPSVKRYVQINIALETGGGDITATSVIARLKF